MEMASGAGDYYCSMEERNADRTVVHIDQDEAAGILASLSASDSDGA